MTDKIEVPEEPEQLGRNIDPLDHDGNGKKGGSKPRKKKEPVGMPDSSWIILEENEDIPPTGLPVSHNGVAYIIRVAEPVLVPNKVLNVLDDAIMTVAITDPMTRRVIGHREKMRYSYRKVAAPADVA